MEGFESRPPRPEVPDPQIGVRSRDMSSLESQRAAQSALPKRKVSIQIAVRQLLQGSQLPVVFSICTLFALWSMAATTIVIHDVDATIFTDNDSMRWALGITIALGVFIGQIIAISKQGKMSQELYFFCLLIDVFYTVRMNHQFSEILTAKVVLAPIIITIMMNYIGFRVLEWENTRAIPSAIGIGMISLVLHLGAVWWGEPTAINYSIYFNDIFGAYWTSRWAEEGMLGRRIR